MSVARAMETLWQDLRFTFRVLRMQPAFTLAAVLTLALGIGANTAIFSAVHALLVRPLPFPAPDRLVYGVALRDGFDPFGTSLLEYAAYRTSTSFERSGIAQQRAFALHGRDRTEAVEGAEVTASFVETLGLAPILGRTFRPDDERPERTPVALIASDLWQTRFGGDASIVGRAMRLDDRTYAIVGVMPPGMDYPARSRIWVPIQRDIETLPIDERAAQAHTFVARLESRATLHGANVEVRTIAERLQRDFPDRRKGWTYKVIPVRQQLLGDLAGRVYTGVSLLVAAVALLLLICCANVASLLLVRSIVREREIAVRLALGAARWRIVRQLLTESVVLAVAGGAAGVVLALWLVPIVTTLNPVRVEALGDVLTTFRIDVRVLAFAVALSLVCGALFGLVPALRVGRGPDVISVLKRREHRTGGAAAGRRALSAVIVLEVTIAVALLATGALVVQSFQSLRQVELGFRPDNLLIVQMTPAPVRFASHEARTRFADEVVRRVRTLPGVTRAGITSNVPLEALSLDSFYTVEGRSPSNAADTPITAHRLVTSNYLETLGVTLVKGRLLNEHDRAGSLLVVVVSEEFARQAWRDQDPIGKRVRRGGPARSDFPWLTVVGVVADVKEDLFNFRIDRPAWYLPYGQVDNTRPLNLLVRTTGDPAAVAAPIRAALHALDREMPVGNVRTMTTHLEGITVSERFSAVLMATLALAGLALAALGLYGVVAYSVTQRTGEIGLRIALGSSRGRVFAEVLRQGAVLVVIGLIAGLATSRGLTRIVENSLYDVSPTDAPTLASAAGVLLAIGLAACLVPAWRATRIDPIRALRHE